MGQKLPEGMGVGQDLLRPSSYHPILPCLASLRLLKWIIVCCGDSSLPHSLGPPPHMPTQSQPTDPFRPSSSCPHNFIDTLLIKDLQIVSCQQAGKQFSRRSWYVPEVPWAVRKTPCCSRMAG